MRQHVEDDEQTFPPDLRYRIPAVCDGVAFWVDGWETEATMDTIWDGEEERTGSVLVVMVGDDHRYRVDPSDLLPIAREDYCGECGQIGCGHDGMDRNE